MHLTRRFFLRTTGIAAAYMGVCPFDLLAASGRTHAAVPIVRTNAGKTIVVIFLRGGADGLNLVIPHGDTHYAALRKNIGIPRDEALELDGFFSLHPRLEPLKKYFDSGHAVAAHAVGYDKNTRSHFEEQDVWETGVVGNTLNSDGWLNRHLATSEGNGPVRAVAVGEALPRILHGDAPAFTIRGLDDLGVPARNADPERVAAALEHAYKSVGRGDRASAQDLLAQTAGTTLGGMQQLRAIFDAGYVADAEYPDTPLAKKLELVARLIKSDIGLEVAEVDLDGWDTHAQQGEGAAGAFAELAGQLSGALAAFTEDLGSRLDDVLVVTLTDFGRTAAENGTMGTDHGWANSMFVVGGGVKRANDAAAARNESRRVVTKWPGLAPDQLHEGRDLLHTTDFRDVLSELVKVHLGNGSLEKVLPGHEFRSVGLIA